MTFAAFFAALWDRQPFPWQTKLAEKVLEGGWPDCIGLPTAAGKTALIDIALYALVKGAPSARRRIFFVVDRRIIVDEAAERAEEIAKKLKKAKPDSKLSEVANSLRKIGKDDSAASLEIVTLRGGILRESWTESPWQPMVICSTVDQLGSSLLFRAYGRTNYAWPISAALAAFDSLVILDEAHISQPFSETLDSVKRYAHWATEPLDAPQMKVVTMSATPRNPDQKSEVFRESDDDKENRILKGRWQASKRARLVEAEAGANENDFGPLIQTLAKNAREMRDQQSARVIGVIANRVGTARAVYESLAKDQSSNAILLTGRARSYDRDELWKTWRASIELGREKEPEKPVFVIATQCIEVGANIDFNALVTEIASIDSLEQRLGRLNRQGREVVSHAVIAAQKNQIGAKSEDPIYGKSLTETWRWLKEHITKEEQILTLPAEGKKKPRTKKQKIEFVEMGVLAFRQALAEADRTILNANTKNAPVLMPAHMDLLCQTSPEPAISPEPSVFLHGPETGPADVQVIWRADLGDDLKQWAGIVAICPPSAAEAISLPIWAVRKWLLQEEVPDMDDMEGGPNPETKDRGKKRPVLVWRGPDESEVQEYASGIRPGATLVVPASYGGCDQWGWNPSSLEPVRDVGDLVKLAIGRPTLRLRKEITRDYEELAVALRKSETKQEAREILEKFSPTDSPGQVFSIVKALLEGNRLALAEAPYGDEWAAVTGRTSFDQSSSRSSYSYDPITLDDHLKGCKSWAERYSTGLPEQVRNTIIRAAELHDIGKADPRFQAWLRGGNPVDIEELLAKSGKSGADSVAIERARRRARYPKGGRHELQSVALLLKMAAFDDSIDHDLLLHLVASHHGRCRPFAPVVEDSEPTEVTYDSWSVNSAHRLESAASGISERFWKLTRRYGWYGLAYLETLLRLADQKQSEEERGA